jgi:hypothetical protein
LAGYYFIRHAGFRDTSGNPETIISPENTLAGVQATIKKVFPLSP